ncbi:alkaline phosphatase D family protein [Pengzhenrongella frigida]|uniref:PhoD-like phosphatase metallophosphatase domain-containing protein n=1 Tax=Pengzhenrongella frigida TaxID=1259133 RepID=A0A4Q5MXB7_9MICO|nr:alkaline phosphatase D family protein [Cellulomonas sp. HLT2-17]RYV50382.1 hypothetical protein EUA98_13910 [Cellulomonas sp. HLT2-17]
MTPSHDDESAAARSGPRPDPIPGTPNPDSPSPSPSGPRAPSRRPTPRRLGWALVAGVAALGLGAALVVGLGNDPEAAPATTATPAASARALRGAAVAPGVAAASDATLIYAVVGAPTTAGFTVSTKTAGAVSVRLVVSPDPTLATGTVYGAPAVPDADGWGKPSVTGLAPGTAYFYAVELTDAAGATTTTDVQGAPATLAGGPASFTVAFGSCLKLGADDEVAFTHLLARSPDLFFHLGDFHYADNSSTSQASHLADLEDQLAGNPALRSVLAAVPTLAIKSDHDAGGGNDAGPGPYTAPNRAAYQQMFATPPLTDPAALYWSFTTGRVKFIFTDHRYPRTATSMMGAAQEAWFKNELTTPEPVKVWVQDSTWNTRADPEPGGDKWSDYPAEHAALGSFIADSAVGKVISLHGDQHALAADDGSHNDWGGFPTFSAGPFRQAASHKGGPWSDGRYPKSTGSVVQQYAVLSVTDTGSSLDVTVTGYDSDDEARVSLTVTVDAPVAVG